MTYRKTDETAQPIEGQLSGFERFRLSWRLFRDDRVPTWMKALVPLVAMVYVLAPIDLIPDLMLGLGQLDDLSVIGIAVFTMTKLLPKLAPRDITDEHLAEMRGSRQRRENRENVIDTTFRLVDEPAQDARRQSLDNIQETRA